MLCVDLCCSESRGPQTSRTGWACGGPVKTLATGLERALRSQMGGLGSLWSFQALNAPQSSVPPSYYAGLGALFFSKETSALPDGLRRGVVNLAGNHCHLAASEAWRTVQTYCSISPLFPFICFLSFTQNPEPQVCRPLLAKALGTSQGPLLASS